MDLPETVYSVLHCAPEELSREMRLAAAAHWNQTGRIFQEWEAKIAEMTWTEPSSCLLSRRWARIRFRTTSLIWTVNASVAEAGIINASPLSLIARSGHLELLKTFAQEVWVP